MLQQTVYYSTQMFANLFLDLEQQPIVLELRQNMGHSRGTFLRKLNLQALVRTVCITVWTEHTRDNELCLWELGTKHTYMDEIMPPAQTYP